MGLINRVVPDAELQAAALAWAARLAAGPTEAFAGIKDNLDHALTADFLSSLDHEADNMVAAAGTMAHREAVRTFVEKRPPDFSRTS